MRALVLVAPNRAEVQDVPEPIPAPGEAVVEVELAGICGTDAELFHGDMAYFAEGLARYPLRPGHEWSGRVVSVGSGSNDSWLGARVVGDTMLGCDTCDRCARGRHYVCANRYEVGVRGGWPGALAEKLSVPVTSLFRLPDEVDARAGAMVEPGANAIRAARACDIHNGDRVLVWGTATVGLLSAFFARSLGADVTVVGRRTGPIEFARTLGLRAATLDELATQVPFDAVIDATNSASVPEAALGLVVPGGRLSLIGLSAIPSTIDTRLLVLNDVTAVGLLGGSLGIADTIDFYSRGKVDPRPLVGRVVDLNGAIEVLAGNAAIGAVPGPKTLVVPRG